ncbi:Hypothetical protein A7982_02287 [Minicystis rosea]|nr:Hypothetical protein A7982_02287 [Minicystis rosea]
MASRGLEKSGSVLWGAAMGALAVTFVVAAGALFYVAGHRGQFDEKAVDAGSEPPPREEVADAAPPETPDAGDAGAAGEADASTAAPIATIAPASAPMPLMPKAPQPKAKAKPHLKPLRPRHR